MLKKYVLEKKGKSIFRESKDCVPLSLTLHSWAIIYIMFLFSDSDSDSWVKVI